MRSTRLYIIAILVLAIALFVVGQHMPHKFLWHPTYAHNDKQPLGAYVFDSIMTRAMPRGYTTLSKSLAQIAADSTLRHSNILIVAEQCYMDGIDFDIMDSMLHEGANVMIATADDNSALVDSTLAYDYGIALRYESSFYLKDSIKAWFNGTQDAGHNLVTWHAEDNSFGTCSFDLPLSLVSAHIYTDDTEGHTVQTLATCRMPHSYTRESSRYFKKNDKVIKRMSSTRGMSEDRICEYIDSLNSDKLYLPSRLPIAVRRKVGRGNLYVVSTPMAFTNYCVLDKKIAPYLMRLMSHLADRPLIRTTCYNNLPDKEHGLLDIIAGNRSLRATYYMLMLTLLLFCLFKARRRQRIIPVVKPPRNYQIEFAQLIGTLYFQRHDNADLVRKKYMMLADLVRTKTHADLLDTSADSQTLPLLARHTGIDMTDLKQQIDHVRTCCHGKKKISDKEMFRAIDFMWLLESQL